MRKILDVIWGAWEPKYFSENQKRLDSPVKKLPDGQITRLCRSIRDAIPAVATKTPG
jgi:hypothetical protein